MTPPRRLDYARLACSTLLAALLIAIVARDFPLVGHDLRYYVPRLLDTLIYLDRNGIVSVQWYTPAFGGGLPAYPNPQHLQHSVLQALTFLVDPWVAFLITTGVVSYVGFYAFAAFLEQRLALSGAAATFGACAFIGNGFWIEHLVVGHVGFQLFPLVAVMLWALCDVKSGAIRNGCVVALTVAAILYHAGIHVIILGAFTLALALPVAMLVRADSIAVGRVVATSAIALPIVAAIGGSKVHAVLSFMRQFPREIDETFAVGLGQALAGLATQFAGVMSLAVPMALLGIDPAKVGSALTRLTGASERLGIWELDISISPAALVLVAVAGVQVIARVRRYGLQRIDRKVIAAATVAAVVTWLLVEATLARGLIYPILKPLPILRSLHVNPRIAASFILPIALVAAAVAHQRYGHRPRVMAILLALSIAAPLTYFLLPASAQLRSFDLRSSLETYARIRAGERLDVMQIVNATDADALAASASSYLPYEPLFGYELDDFKPQTVFGPVHDVRGGAFNMTQPASLVFPVENGTAPFSRIPEADAANLNALVTRGQPQWALPARQQQLDVLSVVALAVAVVGAIVPRRLGRR